MNEESKSSIERERSLFLRALKLSNPDDRAAFLDRECGGHPRLRAAVESLLRNHRDDSFMANPDETVRLPAVTEKPGDMIGRYKLMEKIGEGGFGVVYVAEQREPVRRRVALKISKLGMDTRQVIARFEAERQALALMDHPNIAKVLDGGATPSGRPYFVMELVKGMKVTEFCDQSKLTTRQRLDLFIQICRAVQHAHQKGVIHRDIKPSNILVTLHDGVPVPKVIDFGIAKATQGSLTDKTIYTEFQQFLGTPAYMSPEQAEMSGLDIDTRSDLYSLGVLLYELLTGGPPFDGKELFAAGLDEMRRTIREQEPPRPSVRLGNLTGDELTTTARRHGTEPPKLMHLVQGDLDWIVMKCLEKDRARRYESASGLAADIERHLGNEPIVARPPSNLYRFQKMVRRHKVGFAAGSAIVAAILAGLSVSSLLFVKERQARQVATIAEDKALAEASLADQHAAEEAAERLRAKSALANTYFQSAQRLIADNKKADALAYLVRSLSENPTNSPALLRLSDLLTYSAWMVPTILLEETNWFRSAQFSPDGNRILTVSSKSRVWDAKTGRLLTEFDAVDQADFSSDGSQIMTLTFSKAKTNYNGEIRDAQNGQLLVRAFNDVVEFGPDGKEVLIGSENNTARIWDVSTRQPRTENLKLDGNLKYSKFSHDGKLLVTMSTSNTIDIWNTRTGLPLTKPFKNDRELSSPSFSPDEARILAFSDDAACVWNVETGKSLIIPLQRASWLQVYDGHFSPDGQRIVAVSDNTARVFSALTGQPLMDDLKHRAVVEGAEFAPEGNRIVTASDDQAVQVWDSQMGQPLTEPLDHTSSVRSAQFSSDGKQVITLSDGVWVWNLETEPPLTEPLPGKFAAQKSPLISPDGKMRLVIPPECNSIQIVDAESGKWIKGPLIPNEELRSAQFSSDGKWILSVSLNSVDIWSAEGGQRLKTITNRGLPIFMGEISPDGKRIVTSSDNYVNIWDAQTGQQLTKPLLAGDERAIVASAKFSPDGKRIVTASGGTLRIWNAENGELLGEPSNLNDQDMSFAKFDFDGKRIVTSSSYGVRICDGQTGEPLTEPWTSYIGDRSLSADFDPSAKRLIVNIDADTLQTKWIWDVKPEPDLDADSSRIWDLTPSSVPSPGWVLPLAEAISGKRLDEHNLLKPTKLNRGETIEKIREGLNSSGAHDDWAVWGRWLLSDPATRTISPFSKMKVPEWIERQFDVHNIDGEHGTECLNEVEKYALRMGDKSLRQRVAKARLDPILRLRGAIKENRWDEIVSILNSSATNANPNEFSGRLRNVLEHENVDWLNNVGWNLATSGNPIARDGTLAVTCAELAVKKNGRANSSVMQTLAAAYAETGLFDKAVAAEKEASVLFDKEQEEMGSKIPDDDDDRLKLYEARMPYHRSQAK